MAKVAFIGTGGTISAVGRDPLDILDYLANDRLLHADAIVEAVPAMRDVADLVVVPFRNIASPAIAFADWKALVAACARLEAEHPDLDGIVIGHGTSTLEETAYALSLTVKVKVPVVMVGAQRPLSGLSTDAGMNLVNAVRTAAHPASKGRGVLVMLNDEIQAAREVTKTATVRLQTFRTADFGALGHVDGSAVRYYRRTERRHAPDTEFAIEGLDALPRVDLTTSYVGADGTAVRALVAAGARGLVAAGFAPGLVTPAEFDALAEAVRGGVTVLIATRAGSGVATEATRMREAGFIGADNLLPQKARILLALALTRTADPDEIRRMVATY